MWIDIKSHMIHGSFIPFDKIEWIENRLKSLRTGWKPTEEQMKALGRAIVFHKKEPYIDMCRSLYDDLQKL